MGVANSNRILNKINLGYITNIPSFVEDIPGMRLFDAIGEYRVTTKRRDTMKQKEDGTIERKYDFRITIQSQIAQSSEDIRAHQAKKLMSENLTTTSFVKAVKTHYAVVNYLNQKYPR